MSVLVIVLILLLLFGGGGGYWGYRTYGYGGLGGVLALVLIVILIFWFTGYAHAHDRWANGEPVPPYVKQACCGPADAHHLRPEQIHALPDGYHIDGLGTVVPYEHATPSTDGEYWGFWSDHAVVRPIPVYCLFVAPGAV